MARFCVSGGRAACSSSGRVALKMTGWSCGELNSAVSLDLPPNRRRPRLAPLWRAGRVIRAGSAEQTGALPRADRPRQPPDRWARTTELEKWGPVTFYVHAVNRAARGGISPQRCVSADTVIRPNS
jgi:hypothetical protein